MSHFPPAQKSTQLLLRHGRLSQKAIPIQCVGKSNLHYLCIAFALPLQCLCLAFAMPLQCLRNTFALPLHVLGPVTWSPYLVQSLGPPPLIKTPSLQSHFLWAQNRPGDHKDFLDKCFYTTTDNETLMFMFATLDNICVEVRPSFLIWLSKACLSAMLATDSLQ